MRFTRLLPLLLLCRVASSQNSDLFEKAPPEIDRALRERVAVFYGAHVSGKYREAYPVVAEDAQDDFLAADKVNYLKCETTKITYAENFTKATVVESCRGEFRWHGGHMPATMPVISNWKMADGKWWWYHIHETSTVTPFGISRVTPENGGGYQMPSIPPDPAAAAQAILNQVTIDKADIQLKGYEASRAELHVSNKLPGPVTVSVDRLPTAGTHVKIDKPELPSGETATIEISYDPNDPAIQCGACTVHAALPTLTTYVRISPTSQAFPLTVTFAVPPEIQKQLPKPPKQN